MGQMTLKEVNDLCKFLKSFGKKKWYAMLSKHSIRILDTWERRGRIRIINRVKYPGSRYTDVDWEFL
jgi:hypothetical protein